MLPKNFSSELYHYGVRGMKWGVRRYQNKDGTLTAAGKRRLAKGIKEDYAKDTTNAGYVRLVKSISDELSENYKSQLGDHINNIREKKRFSDRVDEIQESYFDSKDYKLDYKRAYDETYKLFEKDDPDFLRQLIDKNGGDKNTLLKFHDFDKTHDGFLDSISTESLNQRFEKNGIDPKAAYDAYGDYVKACNTAAKTVVGVYGNMKVPKEYSWMNDTTVNQLVSAAMRDIAKEE